MDNSPAITRFQQRLALCIGGGMLLGLGLKRQAPVWEGLALLAGGCLLVRGSIELLRRQADREKQAHHEEG